MTRGHTAAGLIGAALIAAAGMLFTAPSIAQPDSDDVSDLRARIQHLERELQDVQAEVFRNSRGGGQRSGDESDNSGPPPGTSPMMERVSDIEESLRQLTGQVEVLQHRLDDLSTKMDRLQNDMNYRFGNQQGEMGNGETGAPPGGGPQQLAPGPGNLGTVPEGNVNNVPQPRLSPAPEQPGVPSSKGRVVLTPPKGNIATAPAGGAANTQYNAAMDMLARGQYDQAREGFRAVADQYPNDRLAQEALYWTGDISYSAKKDYADAARDFAELLKKYPKAPHAAEGMLKLGDSLIALGQKQEGCTTLAAFSAKYPASSKTLLAKAKADSKKAACK